MGGSVPLGYDSREKKLVVNPSEAKTVRILFERYLAVKSLLKLTEELRSRGLVTKKRKIVSKVAGGIPFTYGPLAYLLKNRTYLGETGHNGAWFPGEHEPIVDRNTFDQVQALLKSNSVARSGRQQQTGALLTGILFDDRGNRMSPSFTVKRGIRYPFYISSAIRNGRKNEVGSVRRVPGTSIEAAVLAALRASIKDDSEADEGLSARSLVEQSVARVVIHSDRIVITPKKHGNAGLTSIETPWRIDSNRDIAKIEEINANSSDRSPNIHLVQAVVRAHAWLKLLADGTYNSIEALAAAVDMHPKVVRAKIRLAFLEPKITKSILIGESSETTSLTKLNADIPLKWSLAP